jgi:hypothetical protein
MIDGIGENPTLLNSEIFSKFLSSSDEDFKILKNKFEIPSTFNQSVNKFTSYLKSFTEENLYQDVEKDVSNVRESFQILKIQMDSICNSRTSIDNEYHSILEINQKIIDQSLSESSTFVKNFTENNLVFTKLMRVCLLEWVEFYLKMCDEVLDSKKRLSEQKNLISSQIEKLKISNDENTIETLKNSLEVNYSSLITQRFLQRISWKIMRCSRKIEF